ncbi:enoyl-CoA hydratase/isomerase family protein [Streptomyces sp. NPDC051940]|uniref:enoyl-CoA hydratase/isomerase family protein n=1 Tax=Streptomyces sp. NPDC051940 TaxID=3155675 RepID=UPI003423EFBA
MNGKTLSVDRDDGLAVVTFRSPPRNLYDAAMREELPAALAGLAAVPPRAVHFRATGRMVSAGVDVQLFSDTTDARQGAALCAEFLALTAAVEALPCPTVFAAHGICLTWAFELALACDLIVASERASFGLTERTVGLTPCMGGTQRLAERAGPGRARLLVLTGDIVVAETLERWGVVDRLLPAAGFDERALRLTRGLAAGPTRAYAAAKQVLRDWRTGGVARADGQLPGTVAPLFESSDLRHGVESFLHQGPRAAVFAGE